MNRTEVRTGPMTWSQEDRWRRVFWRQHGEPYSTLVFVWPIPPSTVDQVRNTWYALVRRHEGLRSRFGLGADGRPIQRVLEFDPDDVPIEVAARTDTDRDTAWQEPLDPDGPLWTVRFLVEGDQQVRSMVLRVEHVLYDVTGLVIWRQQLVELAINPLASTPIAQPIDLAERMPSRDHRQVVRAQERFAELLADAPQVVLPATRQDRFRPRYLQSTATLRGLGAEIQAICEATGGTQPTVLSYVAAWLIGRIARRSSLQVEVLFRNRTGAEHSLVCVMLGVNIRASVDPGQTPRDGIRGLRDTSIRAFLRDRMPQDMVMDVQSKVSAARGVSIRDTVTFNVTGEGLSPEPAPFSVTVEDAWSHQGQPGYNLVWFKLFGDELILVLDVDAAMFTKTDTDAIIADLPVALGRLRSEPDRPFDTYAWSVQPFEMNGDLVRVGPDWVSPRHVADIIAAEPGVTAVTVEADGPALTATIDADPSVPFAALHDRVLAALPHHSDVVAPHRYRRVDSADEWRPGATDPLDPATAAEVAFSEAMLRTHGLRPDFGLSYAAAGGHIGLAPALVVELEQLGYSGLTQPLLLSPSKLRTVVATLRGPEKS
jgi:hypothetical protein